MSEEKNLYRIFVPVLRLSLLFTLLLALQNPSFSKNLVFCYHKVGYSLSDIYTVIPEMLEYQIKLSKDLGIKIVGIDYFTNTNNSLETTLSITFDDGWKIPRETIDFLKTEKTKTTFFIYPSAIGNKSFFSWSELRELTEEGFIVGSHSYTHKFLKDISNDVLYYEIAKSKEYIEKKLGKEVFAFAYPFGIADKNAYSLASKTYKISFVVNDYTIDDKRKNNKLSRYIIFNHTTLGQIREIINNLYNKSNLDYEVYYIKSQVKGLYAKLYHYPVIYPEAKVMVIPSMSIGPAWFKPVIDKLREFNVEVWVFVSEVYSFPFYKYEVYYDRIKDLSLDTINSSLTKAINLINTKNLKVITWGDGMDLTLYLLKDNSKHGISKIIVINPSLIGIKSTSEIKENISIYKQLISKGKYDFESFKENVKTSVLLNLAFLSPTNLTPFKKEFGNISNLEVLKNHLNSNLNLKISTTDSLFYEYIQKVQWSPFYPFSVIEPISYYLGINNFWLSVNNVNITNLPNFIIFYNSNYKPNTEVLKKLSKTIDEKYELSTLDMFLSDEVINKIINYSKENN